MTIWAFNDPNPSSKEFVNKSLKNGISRFGWSWFDNSNLFVLKDKPWAEMSTDEILVWKKANFLLNIKKGDWIVHINTPIWGRCTASEVLETYDFDEEDTEISDFRHFFKIDTLKTILFDRNDEAVHPLISSKLKLRGRFWRIYAQEEFFNSIENLKTGKRIDTDNETKGAHYLKKELEPILNKITEVVHKTHPGKKLEYFMADIFKNLQNVTNVTVNGSGWGTDYGADIIVSYQSGIGILNLQNEETLVVQVKSFRDTHWETNSVNQIETAIEKFKADAGLIVTTAKSSSNLEQAIEELSGRIEKPIGLLSGQDLAKFVMKYEKGILIEI